jgi:cation diffusion facilitator CzcD-associated flavoprotein CzcO
MARKKQNWGKTPWTVSFRPKVSALPDHVDFAVVGGGFTGLSAAAWLARCSKQKSVLVLKPARETVRVGERAEWRWRRPPREIFPGWVMC